MRPARVLAQAQLVNSIGDGAFYVSSALFFSRVVGLSVLEIGVGLTVGWATGLLAGVPVGRVADRLGPRPVTIVAGLVTAVAIGAFLLVRDPITFTLACCLYAAAQTGSGAARQALLAAVVAPAERTAVRARIQALGNAGIGVGAAVGGLALLVGTPAAFVAVFVLDALGFLAAALVLRRLPRGSHAPAAAPARSEVLHDGPYALVTLLQAVMLLYMPMLSVVAPLWIATRTAAPAWTVAGLFVVNTVGVVLLQMRAGRRVSDVPSASRVVRRAGILLLAACGAFAAAALGASPWVAGAILLVAAVLQVCGEVLLSAGGWQLSFDLAPAGRQGQYQGFFAMASSVARAAGPLLLTGLVIGGGEGADDGRGFVGWLVLGVVFLVAGAATGPVARWAAHRSTAHTNDRSCAA
ncbi:MFS transporter [Pseudonocardia oroxyli]|uniref:Major Facilitator Superfamily protein n=1 Tax=Pseudonocardia oroxyli TaxID=366584 RepID=A0A1G7MYD1_PSEOR|nr:MFS transporter [Pseudonocardia oroxyli]SDF66722.1 Major Facilitator Superfamily protein [Pseudonocardia oroxyli]